MRLLRTNPAYRAYFAARITSVAGGAVAPIALAFAILELGGGGTGIAVVPGPVIAWDAATFLLAAAWFARLPRMEGAHDRGGRRRRAELAEGWRAFTARRWLLALASAEACGHAAFMAAFILGPLLAQQRFGGAQDWGLINGALALGSSAGACLASRVRLHRAGWVIAAGGAAFAAGPGAMGAGMALPVVLVAVAAGGLLSGPGQVAGRAAVQIKVPDRRLGRVQGHVLLVESLPVPLVYLGAGTAADAYGAQPVIGACAVVMALAALMPLLVGEVRRLDLSVGSGAEGDAPGR